MKKNIIILAMMLMTIMSCATLQEREERKERMRMAVAEAEVQKVADVILNNNVRESVSNNEHIKNINISRTVVDNNIASDICPKCGGQLVERRGQYGTFYGCSNYPRCRFTISH